MKESIRFIKSIRSVKSIDPCGALCLWQHLQPGKPKGLVTCKLVLAESEGSCGWNLKS